MPFVLGTKVGTIFAPGWHYRVRCVSDLVDEWVPYIRILDNDVCGRVLCDAVKELVLLLY